jgi:hypothetical protein
MTRFTVIVGFAVALGAALQNARADEPKPEQIVDKAIRAHGGEWVVGVQPEGEGCLRKGADLEL